MRSALASRRDRLASTDRTRCVINPSGGRTVAAGGPSGLLDRQQGGACGMLRLPEQLAKCPAPRTELSRRAAEDVEMRDVWIRGAAMTPFGKHLDRSARDLVE